MLKEALSNDGNRSKSLFKFALTVINQSKIKVAQKPQQFQEARFNAFISATCFFIHEPLELKWGKVGVQAKVVLEYNAHSFQAKMY